MLAVIVSTLQRKLLFSMIHRMRKRKKLCFTHSHARQTSADRTKSYHAMEAFVKYGWLLTMRVHSIEEEAAENLEVHRSYSITKVSTRISHQGCIHF